MKWKKDYSRRYSNESLEKTAGFHQQETEIEFKPEAEVLSRAGSSKAGPTLGASETNWRRVVSEEV